MASLVRRTQRLALSAALVACGHADLATAVRVVAAAGQSAADDVLELFGQLAGGWLRAVPARPDRARHEVAIRDLGARVALLAAQMRAVALPVERSPGVAGPDEAQTMALVAATRFAHLSAELAGDVLRLETLLGTCRLVASEAA